MENEKKQLSRKRFLSWSGLGLGALLTFPSGLMAQKKDNPPKGKLVKMLTPDGKLVEVDESVLAAVSKGKKAANKDILHWMKNPSKKD
jgi:hypothetical protein